MRLGLFIISRLSIGDILLLLLICIYIAHIHSKKNLMALTIPTHSHNVKKEVKN